MFSTMIRLLENIKHPVILYNSNTEIGLLSVFLPGVVFARLFTMSNYSNIQFILTFNICSWDENYSIKKTPQSTYLYHNNRLKRFLKCI